MRDGMNALTVINGVKQKLEEIKPSLPAGVEVVAGYDRSGLIHSSIDTLQRDLLEEAIIFNHVNVGRHCRIRRAIIAPSCTVLFGSTTQNSSPPLRASSKAIMASVNRDAIC